MATPTNEWLDIISKEMIDYENPYKEPPWKTTIIKKRNDVDSDAQKHAYEVKINKEVLRITRQVIERGTCRCIINNNNIDYDVSPDTKVSPVKYVEFRYDRNKSEIDAYFQLMEEIRAVVMFNMKPPTYKLPVLEDWDIRLGF